MSDPKIVEQRVELGGGLVLLCNSPCDASQQKFAFGQPYSLGDNDSFCLNPGGLIADAMVPLGLLRMDDICQLQFLSTVGVDAIVKQIKGPHTFAHKRLIHNLRAGVLHAIIPRNCSIVESAMDPLGILGDCGHDNFICAGGDSWKDINHQKTLFDEDEDFAGKILSYYGEGWRKLCSKYNFHPQEAARQMQEIVDGQGLRGEIHEIADTASYLLGDLEQIKLIAPHNNNASDFAEVLYAAKQPWDIWNYVTRRMGDSHLIITNPIALNNFLMLRILLWRDLYQNPARKVQEMLMRDIVYPYLVDRKIIKISDLPKKTDSWLFGIVEKEMGWKAGQSKDLNVLGSFPLRRSFASWQDALYFEEQQFSNGVFTLVFSVADFQKTKSKTDKYWVINESRWGKVETFKSAYPAHAEIIDEISRKTMEPDLPVQVVYVYNPVMSKNFYQAWQEARDRWKKKKDK